MPLLPLHGHESLRARLKTAAERERLPQSLLLHGAAGVGKQRLALWLGQLLLCQQAWESRPCGTCQHCRYALQLAHPDLHWVFPRGRLRESDMTVENVRDDLAGATAERAAHDGLYASPPGGDALFVATMHLLIHEAAMTPAMARRKVFLVGDADRMALQEGSEFAANAFLKLLEEPPANTTIILTTSAPDALLPTIRSRVVSIRVAPLSDSALRAWMMQPAVSSALEALKLPRRSDDLVRLAAGSPGRLLDSTETASATEAARELLEVAESGNPAKRYRAALSQGVAGARGKFTDILDALTAQLHDRTKTLVAAADERRARNVALAINSVEDSKLMAAGNVNPQLITAALLRDLSRSLSD